MPGEIIEMVNFMVTAIAAHAEARAAGASPGATAPPEPAASAASCFVGGAVDAPVYRRDALLTASASPARPWSRRRPRSPSSSPASGSTVDRWGNLLIDA